jgi:UDP-N-acetylglucosamine--N-acetylmuramyl-(pentapeptide) pyrophosphoryl-undecaprenol N-acetylglucosamine transferase
MTAILFAGGGTGGHLFPALAVAEEIRLRRPDIRIVFVGTRERIEARLVPRHGFEFHPIRVTGLRRRLTADNLLVPVRAAGAVLQSLRLMRGLRPAVVVGTGGYVCGPVGAAAVLAGVPLVLHEQNSIPGMTTRMLAGRATEVHVTFGTTRNHLRRQDNVRLTGNPVRRALGTVSRADAAARFGFRPDCPTLLVFGGSLGARSINDAVLQTLPRIGIPDLQVLWQTGEGDEEGMRNGIAGVTGGTVRIQGFIDDMEYAYGCCDLALCRAGATTLAELTRTGVPSVLVPYPFAADDHQTANARTLADAGAAEMLTDAELPQRLGEVLARLLRDPARLGAMSSVAQSLGRPDATGVLATAVLAIAERRQ